MFAKLAHKICAFHLLTQQNFAPKLRIIRRRILGLNTLWDVGLSIIGGGGVLKSGGVNSREIFFRTLV